MVDLPLNKETKLNIVIISIWIKVLDIIEVIFRIHLMVGWW